MTLAEHSKAVGLLLLIFFGFCCSIVMCVSVCVGGMVDTCFVVHYLVSSFTIISLGKKEN